MNDAEHMRRALVASEDSAEAARTGLEQQAPLATALAQHFPRSRSKIINGIEVCGDTHSLEGVVAGDWWDVFTCPGGGVGFVIGDVAGHGDRAAIVAVQMQAVLRGAITSGASPAAALHLASCAVPSGPTFFTAIVGVIHKDHTTLTVANAGHPSAIHLHGNELHPFTPSGPLVSALGGTWQDTTHSWQTGDRLMCITDGLAACDREMGIAHVLLNQPENSTVVDQVSAAMAALRDTTPAWSEDDVTMVMLRQTRR
jgi:serine phosphatase RsbU (regulator of sigma subunit)